MQVSRNAMLHSGDEIGMRQRLALRVRDGSEGHVPEAEIEAPEIGKILAPMKGGQRSLRDRPNQWEMKMIDVEMQDIELVAPLAHLIEHEHVVRDRITHRRIEPQGGDRTGNELGRSDGIPAREQGD